MLALRTPRAPDRGRRPVPTRARAATRPRHPAHRFKFALALLPLWGCSITPSGTEQEQARLAAAGKPYEPKHEERALPELPEAPTWQDVLRRAFLANGDLEAAYFNWKAAVERIDIASAYPNSDVSLGFDYMFSGARMKSFDRGTFTAGFDSATNLTLPVKAAQAGKVALDEARAAGERFRVAKFELQRTVLRTWADYALQQQAIAWRGEDVALRRVLAGAAAGSAGAGRRAREAIATDLDLRTAENELLDLRAQHELARVNLNSLLSREPKAALHAPTVRTPARLLPDDDDVMLSAAADVFPEVSVMAREVEGRADALELARLRWIPDISPTLGFTGSIAQTLGAMVTLPTTAVAIRGQIREAEANLRASQAILRQRSSDRVGEYVGLLVMYRNAQRRAEFFENTVLPTTQRLSDERSRAYESGAATFAEIIESRRVVLGVREMIAVAHAEMDKAVVEIECCLGVDIEALAALKEPAVVPATSAAPPAQPAAPTSKETAHAH